MYEQLMSDYLRLLLQGKRHESSQLIMDAVANEMPIKDIYLHVFQPAQHEIGRLWQTNEVTVAQEHFCTATTQLIMSQLYPYIFNQEKNGLRLLATCVGGELHEIGLRMVTDFFEMDGWDTYYLGANMPTEGILATIEKQKPNIVAISTSMPFNVGTVTQLIADIRGAAYADDVRILVGGRPFNVSPNLWQRVGADAYALDAEQALQTAAALVAR